MLSAAPLQPGTPLSMLCNRCSAPRRRQRIGRADLRHVTFSESKAKKAPITALGEEELQDAGGNMM